MQISSAARAAPSGRGEPVRAVPISVRRAPHVSVVLWMAQLGSTDTAHPVLPRRFAATASRAGRPALSALAHTGRALIFPDITVLNPGSVHDTALEQHVEYLRSADGAGLAAEIDERWEASPPLPWRQAAAAPRAWMQSLATATTDAWGLTRSHWQQAGPALDREIARIGTAVVTGATDALLNSLNPHLTFRDQTMRVTSRVRSVSMGDRRLVLVPNLDTTTRMWIDHGNPDVVTLTYSLRRTAARRPAAGLAELIGPLRATALLRLGRPVTMAQLALLLQCAPSTATYHCDQLVAAGLVTRVRDRTGTWVQRTRRGEELIEIYGSVAG